QAGDHTDAHEPRALPQDEPQHIRGPRPEGHADADLAHALAHGVGDDAVDTDSSERDREGSEDREQTGAELSRPQALRDYFADGPDISERQITVERLDLGAQRG